MSPPRVVAIEPVGDVWNYEQNWESNLCDSCSSCRMCMCAFFCLPCFTCKTMSRAGECYCQPLLPCALMSFKTKIRTAFRINGSICTDCFTSTFCPICTITQIANELDKLEDKNQKSSKF